jgi:CubicO group peptidase (beta-lactamase class C family)
MVRIRHAAALALLSLAIPAAVPVHAQPAASCGVPTARNDGWPIATQAKAGLDGARLCALSKWLDGFPKGNVHSVIVARRGALVFERYFPGDDEIWGRPVGVVEHGPAIKHDLRSVTKSVTSLLVGIALDRQLIASIDEPMFKFFPEHADLRTPAKDRILIRHLLTMSAGLAWNETIPYSNPANSERRMTDAPNPYRYILEQRLADPPGERFNYSGGATQLLAGILQKAGGKPLDAFAREALFAPLGIADITWTKMPNSDVSAASGLRLTSRDLAKLGQTVLARGEWNGRRVVSADWIAQSTTPQIEAIDFLFYGHQWWLGRSLIDRRELPWTMGLGLGGQRLFVVPALDLVVVITAGLYNSPMQRWVPWEIFRRYVVDAVR